MFCHPVILSLGHSTILSCWVGTGYRCLQNCDRSRERCNVIYTYNLNFQCKNQEDMAGRHEGYMYEQMTHSLNHPCITVHYIGVSLRHVVCVKIK